MTMENPICPSCGHKSVPVTECLMCGWGPGYDPKEYASKRATLTPEEWGRWIEQAKENAR
jgi:ribosomal protein L32